MPVSFCSFDFFSFSVLLCCDEHVDQDSAVSRGRRDTLSSDHVLNLLCNLTTQKPAPSPVKPKDSSSRIGKLQVKKYFFVYFQSNVSIRDISLLFLLRKDFSSTPCTSPLLRVPLSGLFFHIPTRLLAATQQHDCHEDKYLSWFDFIWKSFFFFSLLFFHFHRMLLHLALA